MIKKLLREKNILIFIFLFSLFLRFYKLGEIPQVLTRDEAAIGYNAYSILKTGRDEYGVKFPLWFLSFGDYKPPLYIYLTAPIIGIFGLNEFSIRFLSALSGSLTILIVYLLANELFKNYQKSFKKTVSLGFAFLLATAPFHIFYSQMAYVSNFALFLTTTGLFFYLKARENNKYFFLSLLFFSSSLFTYNSTGFILPLLLPLVFFFFKKEFKKPAIFIFLTSFYIIYFLFILISKQYIKGRLEGTIFDKSYIESEFLNFTKEKKSKFISRPKLFIAYKVINNYFSVFKKEFLFFGGDGHPWHDIGLTDKKIGNQYLITLPLFLAGVFLIFKIRKKETFFLLSFFLISPLACTFTQDVPNTNRLLEFLFLYLFIASIGIYYISTIKKIKALILTITGTLFFISLFNYFDIYLHLFNKKLCSFTFKESFLCGSKEISRLIKNKKYDKVFIVTNEVSEEPYIQLAFYLKFSPEDFQKNASRKKEGFIYVEEYKNIYIYLNKDKKTFVKINQGKGKRNLLIVRQETDQRIKDLITNNILEEIKDSQGNNLWITGELL